MTISPSLSLSLPIPLNPPDSFFSEWTIPGVGELMSPSFSTSITSISETVTNWWIGEKYDGVRVCWNPDRMILLGNEVNIPLCFKNKMPHHVFLDGEIWFGRGGFAETAAIYSCEEVANYPFLKIVAFDKPDFETQIKRFEKRYGYLLHNIAPSHPFIMIAMRFINRNREVLKYVLEEVMEDGGEGVIVRQPHSFYVRGRSHSLWKLKTQREDTEALVVKVEEDSTYLLQLPKGTTFYAPAPKEATVLPKKGDVVTFFYDNFTQHSLPSNPSIFRIRVDLNWDDVLRQHAQDVGDKVNSNFMTKPRGYWSNRDNNDNSREREKESKREEGRERRENREKGKANMRKFLESFARARHCDPLLSHSWYQLADELRKQKELRAMVAEYGSYIKALVNLFPEIHFEHYQFSSLPNVGNRHKYLLEFAAKKNFDPLHAQSWYSLSLDDILREKEITSIVSYYNYNFTKALIHLFPNIGLEPVKLSALSGNPYNIKYQRQIFLNYAQAKGFDPLGADHWYDVDFPSMRPVVDTRFIERIYQGKFATAVMTFFPTIGLSRDKFDKKDKPAKTFSLSQQKEFFDSFAKEKGFDALLAENWHSVDIQQVLSTKNGYAILSLYNKSLANALARVYPNVKFIHSAFGKRQKEHHAAFSNFAQSHGFDPLIADRWYPIHKRLLYTHQGAKKVLGFYKDDMVQALMTVYPHIGLVPEKFGSRKKQYWSDPEARRRFFDSLCHSLSSFDPLVPDHWYSHFPQIQSLVSSHKDGVNVLKYHNMSISQSLIDLYPNMGLKKERFKLI